MNKLFKKTLKGFLLATFVATMLSTIQNASAHEDAHIQTLLYSTYDIPYLALTTDEVRIIVAEDLADLVSDRANKICQNRGYHSAIDFDLESGAGNRAFYFDNKIVEVAGKWKPVAMTISLGIILPILGTSLYKSIANQPISNALMFVTMVAGGTQMGYLGTSTFLTAKRMEGIKLEGSYGTKYLYFNSIDCLSTGEGVSNERIAETKLRYTCNVLQDNDSACNEASVREVSCLVNLSSKDDSPQICKDLAVNIQDDKEFQCTVADIGGYKLPEVCNL